MNILHIDDDPEVHERLRFTFEDLDIEWSFASARDEVALAIEHGKPDIVICDLKMPAETGGADLAIEHGVGAAALVRALAPGVPLFIYSGFKKDGNFEDLVSRAHPRDLYGTGERDMVRSYDKTDPDPLEDAVRDHFDELKQLEAAVEIVVVRDGGRPLDELDRRVLRIYARSRGGAVIRVRAMDGGRSSARTVAVQVENDSEQVVANVVAKLNALSMVRDEATKLGQHVAGVLGAGHYSDSTQRVEAGARDRGGAFYSYAETYPTTLFDLLTTDLASATTAVVALREVVSPWTGNCSSVAISLGLVLDELVPLGLRHRIDFDFDRLNSLSDLKIPFKRCAAHRDLHGGNVLAKADGTPILIDFGEAGDAPALWDPITLELSTVLHPDAARSDEWPSNAQAFDWDDLNNWLLNCPYGDFVSACRAWQSDVARGRRDVDAVLLGYSLGQMRHDGARTEILQNLVDGAIHRLEASR